MTSRPAAIDDLAARLGAVPRGPSQNVRLEQQGRMKQNLETDGWMPFAASQIATRNCAFDWRARAGPLGVISARDALQAGRGRFEVTALGFIPLARAAPSPMLIRGQLMRYLAELAWAPDAILHNDQLRWREDGPETLFVSAGAGETAVEVMLSLDKEGRIGGAFAPDRPRSLKPPFLPTPWRGRFSDYRRQAGRWLPFAGEVAWEVGGREIIYWQGQIKRWEVIRALS